MGCNATNHSVETRSNEITSLREAVKRHCLDFLEGWSEVVGDEEAYDTMPLSQLYSQAEAFIAGYKTASKKIQPVSMA